MTQFAKADYSEFRDLNCVGSKNSAELQVPHFTGFLDRWILPSQPVDFIRQPWRLARRLNAHKL